MINVKSIFAIASDKDGFRILAEPVWPKKAPTGKRSHGYVISRQALSFITGLPVT